MSEVKNFRQKTNPDLKQSFTVKKSESIDSMPVFQGRNTINGNYGWPKNSKKSLSQAEFIE
jgi:hypothetical protein